MGRILRRVSLDFDWPLHEPWDGFINRHFDSQIRCPHCEGSGYSPEAEKLLDKWMGYGGFKPEDRGSTPFKPDDPFIEGLAQLKGWSNIERSCQLHNESWSHHLNEDDVQALLDANRLLDLTHTFKPGQGWTPKPGAPKPTPEDVNRWSMMDTGHDSINRGICIEAECKRLGIEKACSHCEGNGRSFPSPEIEDAARNWTPTPPPEGDGYQVWETVSEGSPISPVFETPEALAQYMAEHPYGTDKGKSYDDWMHFISGDGYAPSFVITTAR